jgi:hypothetical protein
VAPPLHGGHQWHGADRQRVIDHHVQHRDHRDQHAVAEEIEVKDGKVHRTPFEPTDRQAAYHLLRSHVGIILNIMSNSANDMHHPMSERRT